MCSQAHQSLFQLPPSIWCAAVAVPHRNPSGKARAMTSEGSGPRWRTWPSRPTSSGTARRPSTRLPSTTSSSCSTSNGSRSTSSAASAPTSRCSASSAARSPARPSSPRHAPSTRTTARSTRCTPTSCDRATRRCRSSTRSTASATAAASRPDASSPSSTARPSSTWRRRSTKHEDGLEHQAPMPADVPAPEELPTLQGAVGRQGRATGRVVHPAPPDRHPHVDWESADRREPLPPRQHVWLRAVGRLPDDPILHNCVLDLRVGHDPARHDARCPTAASTRRAS